MRILYFSDNYGHEIMSLKRIIREELERRGIDIVYCGMGDMDDIVGIVDTVTPDQVWLVHSGLTLPIAAKDRIKPPIIGFGFSDPHYFDAKRLESYDIYMTAHYETYLRYKDTLPVMYNPDTYDPAFYCGSDAERDIDLTCVGNAVHPRFENPRERIEIVDRLRAETNLNIVAYGHGWPPHFKNHGYIAGEALLSTINRSKIGLDIQGGKYSISERVLHYSGCGIPVITRESIDVSKSFAVDKEILTYDSYDALKDKLLYYMSHQDQLRKIGKAAQRRCKVRHTVQSRVDDILAFLEGVAA